MKDNIIDIPNLDIPIYRIFSYQRFVELFQNQELVLVNPSKWDDPFENFFLKTEVDCGVNNGVQEIATLDSIANDWYGQCWTTNSDTDAMWRIYSHDKDGIRVKTTVKKLFTSIYNSHDSKAKLKYFIGSVQYKSRSDITAFLNSTSFTQISTGGQNNGFARLLCIKRTEFSHESEIRIMINDLDKQSSNQCFRVSFDPNALLEEVCIDPRATKSEYQILESIIKQLGVTLPIIQSDLYQMTLPRIKL